MFTAAFLGRFHLKVLALWWHRLLADMCVLYGPPFTAAAGDDEDER